MRFCLTVACPECRVISDVPTCEDDAHKITTTLRKTVVVLKWACASCRFPLILRIEVDVHAARDYEERRRRDKEKDRARG